MKTLLLKPGFEIIFSLSLIAILALPPVLLAQNTRDVDIQIVNGDTTVNGKNIKELSKNDRKQVLRDINRMSGPMDNGRTDVYSFKRNDSMGGGMRRMELRRRRMGSDSAGDGMGPGRNFQNHSFTFPNENGGNRMAFRGRGMNPGMMMAERRNSQNFDYVTTDNEGVSTHVRFHVSEITNEDLKKMPHVEGGKFEISDLNLVPEFSTGKTLLMFTLPAKTTASVKMTDSQGKLLFEEKGAGSSFSKTFALGLNGIYYLQVRQGNNIAIKKIVKEE